MLTAQPHELPPPSDGLGTDIPRVSRSEVLSALSRALDLTEGQPEGHTLRACAIAMRIAEETGVPEEERSALYYAMLLKDAGCSSNASRMAALFGSDDRHVKLGMKLVDWHRLIPTAIQTLRMSGVGSSIIDRLQHFLGIARSRDVTRELIEIRCDRGADIAARLGFPSETAETVRSLDEHWCGLGYPDGRSGDDIPMLSRIANISQTVEIFVTEYSVPRALRMARRRSGTWFDPAFVRIIHGWRDDKQWWEELRSPQIEQTVIAMEPGARVEEIDENGLDEIARAFAEIIDAKSPFTYRHSSNVADYAVAIGKRLGLSEVELRNLYRAGLLHDIGKLGVSSRILNKNGKLDDDEREEIERHPLFSWQILSRVAAFEPFARTAVVHHEKLDGTGYPWNLTASQLTPAERALCVADIYEALTADRPYRAGMEPEKALSIIRKDVPNRLCAEAVEALESSLG